MSGIEEQVSVGAMPPTASTADRYSDDGDDYGDESFGADEPEPQAAAPSFAAAPADAAPQGTTSERVQDFIKKSGSSAALDDQRLLARPLFDELLKSKRLSEWNEGECVVWLSSIGLERYRQLFFHHHVSGKTLEKMTTEKLRDDVGIGALGHRELIMDEIEELKAQNSEFLKKLNKRRNEKRQLEKSEERRLESLHMELLRREVEHKQAQDALEKAQAAEREKLVAVERQRAAIASFQQELKQKKKEEAVQNYGRISDLKQCTFRPALTMTSIQFAQNSERGEMWDRIKSDLAQKEQKMKDMQRVNEDQAGIQTRGALVRKAEAFMKEYTHSEGEFANSMVDKALEAGMMEDHCTAKEKDTIEAKKGEDKLISAYNVLRIHQFLGKYESDLNHRRSRNAKDKKPRLSKEQREERDAAISHLVARMHPEPPSTDKRKMSEEGKNRMKVQRKKNKELVNHFLANYEEDMHKRRLHIKQARRLAAEEDAAKMAKPKGRKL